MFTGIVIETGIIDAMRPAPGGIGLWVRACKSARGLKPGDSLAVNGCCLTVERIRPCGKDKILRFTVLEETRRLTNLQFAKPGVPVNLEPPLRAGDPIGGHFVTGHIDGIGIIKRWERSGNDYILEIAPPPGVMRYVVLKGSIAVDGISLTVAAVRRKSFDLWIIPHTRAVTALADRTVGDAVNLEADILGKYVERGVSAYSKARSSANAV